MSRGVILLAHNNSRTDYYRMAVTVAQRVERFLNLPVTIITDQDTLDTTGNTVEFKFDRVCLIDPDKSNHLKNKSWYNKGRYQVYELSPYDETLVIDTDYMINSTALLRTFDQPSDFVCYRTAKYAFESFPDEHLNAASHKTYWATVLRFNKTERAKQIFDMIKTIQHNYEHYAELHQFLPYTYRNDYALTIALRTVNGQVERPEDFITGELYHIDDSTVATRLGDTHYRFANSSEKRGRNRSSYIEVKDFDFHVLDKENFMSLIV